MGNKFAGISLAIRLYLRVVMRECVLHYCEPVLERGLTGPSGRQIQIGERPARKTARLKQTDSKADRLAERQLGWQSGKSTERHDRQAADSLIKWTRPVLNWKICNTNDNIRRIISEIHQSNFQISATAELSFTTTPVANWRRHKQTRPCGL